MVDQISPWFPEQDQIRLAVLGKLIEECNELAARAARCIIHGLEEADPDSGRANAEELEREMADVWACLDNRPFGERGYRARIAFEIRAALEWATGYGSSIHEALEAAIAEARRLKGPLR